MKKSEKKKVVIFDIDFTVFNTAAFRKNLYQLLAIKLGYNNMLQFNQLARQTEQETKEQVGYFKPRIFLSFLQKKTKKKVKMQELEEIFFNESLYIESLYEDSRDVFQELVIKKNIDIIIFSTGEKEFQMQKINSLHEMLKEDQIHIFVDKLVRLKEILIKYNDSTIYLVDDLPTVLSQAKKLNPDIITIWINHDRRIHERDFFDEREPRKGFKTDKIISELKEIIPIVTAN